MKPEPKMKSIDENNATVLLKFYFAEIIPASHLTLPIIILGEI